MRKVTAGDPLKIPARTFNTFVDSAQHYLDRHHSTGRNADEVTRNTGVVLVRNDSLDDRGRFDVLAAHDSIIDVGTNADEYYQRVALEAREPVAGDKGTPVVLLEPIAVGKIGRAVVSGVVQVQVEVPDFDTKSFADLKEGETEKLVASGSGSAQIIDILVDAAGTFPITTWAVVRLGNTSGSDVAVFVLDEHLEQGDADGVDGFKVTERDPGDPSIPTDPSWTTSSNAEKIYGHLFTGVAFENDIVGCVNLDGKWYATTGGHIYLSGKAAEDGDTDIDGNAVASCIDIELHCSNSSAGGPTNVEAWNQNKLAIETDDLVALIWTSNCAASCDVFNDDPVVGPPDWRTGEFHILMASTESGDGDSATLAAGCGIEIDETTDVDGNVTKTFNVDASDLDGNGLVANAASGSCELAVETGCGLTLSGNAVVFDADTVAGDALSKSGDCKLNVNAGCGLVINAANGLDFEPDDVAGCGLEASGTGCELKVDASELAGDALSESGDCKLNVNAGCGLVVNAANSLNVNPSELAGCGLEASGTDCELQVDATALAGDGLSESGACTLNVNAGCGIVINSANGVELNPSELAGCGLEASGTDCELQVDATELAGDGLSVSSSCTLNVTAGCGIVINAAGAVETSAADLAGDGLAAGGSGCELDVVAGCGLEILSSGGVAVNATELAGDGLSVSSSCTLNVTAGCGVVVNSAGAIEVEASELAGDGLTQGGTGCELDVVAGCGLEILSSGGVAVNATELAGDGLSVSQDCQLNVTAGCGIVINAAGGVETSAADLAGDGLAAGGSGCELDVVAGCGLEILSSGGVAVNASELAGDGLSVSSSCTLNVTAGCGIVINAAGGVEVNADDLAGNGLTASATGCGLEIDCDWIENNCDVSGATGPAGPQGYQGDDGATGPAGPQGYQGDDGATGPAGPQGYQGYQGDDGATGPAGPQGHQGDAGATGPTGPAGPQGDDGATGPAGPQGNDGAAGPQGHQGNDGATGPAGPQGDDGATGPAGPQGNDGAAGPQGHQGNDGATGPAGPQGNDGATGPAGPQGNDGAAGPQGHQGDDGATGPAGPQGNDGAAGPQGHQGDDGATGPTGPAGPQGNDGATGPAGPAGPQGDDGATGPAGPAGPQGDDGATGPAGPAGPQGDDGAAGPAGPAGPQGDDGAAGPAGPQGNDGAAGPAGPQGDAGATGGTGPAGPQGDDGAAGGTGAAGPQGDAGASGPQGDSGDGMTGIDEDTTPQLGGNLDMNGHQIVAPIGVGINSNSADGSLHVHTASAGTVTASTSADDIVVENSGSVGMSFLTPDGSANQTIYFGTESAPTAARLRYKAGTGDFQLVTGTSGGLVLTDDANVHIGSTGIGIGTSATRTLVLQNGTAPGSSPSNRVQIYSNDSSIMGSPSAELFVRNESGTETQLTRHAFDCPEWLIDHDDPLPQVDRELNVFAGVIRFTNRSRQSALIDKMFAGDAMPVDPLERQCVVCETFDEYNARRGLTGDAALTAEDWEASEQRRAEERSAEQAEWQADHDIDRPADYVVRDKPEWMCAHDD